MVCVSLDRNWIGKSSCIFTLECSSFLPLIKVAYFRCVGMCCSRCVGMCCDRCVGMCCDTCVGMCCDRCVGMCCDRCVGMCCDRYVGMCCDRLYQQSLPTISSLSYVYISMSHFKWTPFYESFSLSRKSLLYSYIFWIKDIILNYNILIT